MRLIMLSPPGAGQGAHASELSQTTGVAYISSGALPRAKIARGGDLGRRFAQYTSRGDLTVFEGQRRGRLPTGGALAGGVELLQAAMSNIDLRLLILLVKSVDVSVRSCEILNLCIVKKKF